MAYVIICEDFTLNFSCLNEISIAVQEFYSPNHLLAHIKRIPLLQNILNQRLRLIQRHPGHPPDMRRRKRRSHGLPLGMPPGPGIGREDGGFASVEASEVPVQLRRLDGVWIGQEGAEGGQVPHYVQGC